MTLRDNFSLIIQSLLKDEEVKHNELAASIASGELINVIQEELKAVQNDLKNKFKNYYDKAAIDSKFSALNLSVDNKINTLNQDLSSKLDNFIKHDEGGFYIEGD